MFFHSKFSPRRLVVPTHSVKNSFNWLITASLVLFCMTSTAGEQDARNILTIATGVVPAPDDQRVVIVSNQLNTIAASCAPTGSAGVHEKLAKANSMVRTKVNLLLLVSDFVTVAKAQCQRVDLSTLTALYVLEMNESGAHAGTISKLKSKPLALVAKWSRR